MEGDETSAYIFLCV